MCLMNSTQFCERCDDPIRSPVRQRLCFSCMDENKSAPKSMQLSSTPGATKKLSGKSVKKIK